MINSKSRNNEIKSGSDVARYFIYFSRLKTKPNANLNIVNISGKSLYKRFQDECDAAYKIIKKYGLNGVAFLKYFVDKFGTDESCLLKLKEHYSYVWYAEHIKIQEQHEKIYGYYMKSVNNIVDECIKRNFRSTKEYIKMLVTENKLGEAFISGQISQYYLASIVNFPKILKKMDELNQDTLRTIAERREKLNSDLQDAFMAIRSQKVSTISFTDKALFQRLGI